MADYPTFVDRRFEPGIFDPPRADQLPAHQQTPGFAQRAADYTAQQAEQRAGLAGAVPPSDAAAAPDARAVSVMMPDGSMRMVKPGDEPKGARKMGTQYKDIGFNASGSAPSFGDIGKRGFDGGIYGQQEGLPEQTQPGALPMGQMNAPQQAPVTTFGGSNTRWAGPDGQWTDYGRENTPQQQSLGDLARATPGQGSVSEAPGGSFDYLLNMNSGGDPAQREHDAQMAALRRGESIDLSGGQGQGMPAMQSFGTYQDPAAASRRRNVLSDIAYQDRRGRGYQANVVRSMMEGIEDQGGGGGINDFQKAQMKAYTDAQPSYNDFTTRADKAGTLKEKRAKRDADQANSDRQYELDKVRLGKDVADQSRLAANNIDKLMQEGKPADAMANMVWLKGANLPMYRKLMALHPELAAQFGETELAISGKMQQVQ